VKQRKERKIKKRKMNKMRKEQKREEKRKRNPEAVLFLMKFKVCNYKLSLLVSLPY
jgi:hypothetical protein